MTKIAAESSLFVAELSRRVRPGNADFRHDHNNAAYLIAPGKYRTAMFSNPTIFNCCYALPVGIRADR